MPTLVGAINQFGLWNSYTTHIYRLRVAGGLPDSPYTFFLPSLLYLHDVSVLYIYRMPLSANSQLMQAYIWIQSVFSYGARFTRYLLCLHIVRQFSFKYYVIYATKIIEYFNEVIFILVSFMNKIIEKPESRPSI